MNRGERREISKRKWISRAKKIYNSLCYIEVPIKGVKAYSCRYRGVDVRVCESITDFLNNSKFAKTLKNCTVPYRSKMRQIDAKMANRKERKQAQKEINRELNELYLTETYNNLYLQY